MELFVRLISITYFLEKSPIFFHCTFHSCLGGQRGITESSEAAETGF